MRVKRRVVRAAVVLGAGVALCGLAPLSASAASMVEYATGHVAPAASMVEYASGHVAPAASMVEYASGHAAPAASMPEY